MLTHVPRRTQARQIYNVRRKMMKHSFAIFAALTCLMSSFVSGSPPYCVPPALAPLENEKPTAYLAKISDLPQSVVDAVKTAMRGGKLHMADRGGAWNETDDVDDPSLPFRRLLWATEVKKYFVIHYEMGGIGYSTHFLVISPEEKTGNRRLVWSAVSFSKASDFDEFFRLLQAGKIDSDPRFIH